LGGSEHAVVSDHAAFGGRAMLHFNDAGDDSGVRKVHLMQALTAICERLAVFHLDQAKVRPQVFEIDRACSGQNPILRMEHCADARQAKAQMTPSHRRLRWLIAVSVV
jgi:hypothetical protein